MLLRDGAVVWTDVQGKGASVTMDTEILQPAKKLSVECDGEGSSREEHRRYMTRMTWARKACVKREIGSNAGGGVLVIP